MEKRTIRPILGLKTDVPQNDPSLFVGDACHCVAMQNVDLTRLRNASRKSFGKTQYTDTANGQHTRCQGLFELRSGTAVDHLYWDNGKFYYLNSSLALTNVDASSPVTFSQADGKYFSVVNVGGYAIMTDTAATLTPYKWKNGDANLTKLIQTGTEYKFRYLATFQRRIIGAYSDQTDGDIEIRWTQPWTESNYFASACTMAAANQLFKPGDDIITGIKNFGSNACFLYGENSIDSIDYYQNYTTPFAIRNMVAGHGCAGHHSIVDAGGAHYLFNKNYGFVSYRGGAEFPAGVPISYEIENKISEINSAYYDRIIGAYNPNTKECVWAVPLGGDAIPNAILKYNIVNKQWHIKNEVLRYVDFWTIDSSVTWNDLAALGYSTWNDIATLRWSDIASSKPYLSFGNTDGHLYTESGETDNGSAFDGYRVEPIISLSETQRALLLEIWFGLASVGNYSIYVYYRSGDSEAECENAGWNELTSVSANSPDNAVTYVPNSLAVVNRYHQIKWGTDGSNEPFGVNSITFGYVPQGEY